MDTSGISFFAELISKYGIAVVIIAVFILVFIVLFRVFLKYIDNTFETLKKQNEAYFERLTKPVPEPQILDTHLKLNEMIGQRLRKLRDITDADRTFIYMFHNTDHGIGGFPFLSVS